ncbi:DUF4333 domain-containing protein [Nocardia sp. NPDC087230]|jgi:hypothetical protein|uniref:DUF4333 domain-containing protein n=1 Tax=unclassified Nocardia TaxID=2637762 RepID=UPI00319E0647
MRTIRTIPAVLAALLSVAAVSAGCSVSVGTATVDKEAVAEQISTQLQAQVGETPDEVTCPEDLKAEQGATMTCTLTEQGATYDVKVTVTSVEGDNTKFDIEVADAPN